MTNLTPIEALLQARPEHRQTYNYWCDMLWRWPARSLHGLTDQDAVAFAVQDTMLRINTRLAEDAPNMLIFVNPARPVQFAANINGHMQYQEMVLVPTQVRLQ